MRGMSNQLNKKYGLFTTMSMVVGIVVGSGIFFKADDVLAATGGNVLLGVLGFILVGVGVVFGALTIAQYALKNDKEGGMIPYAIEAFGSKFGFAVGWFITVVYFPALVALLSWVFGLYTTQFLGIENTVFIWVFAVLALVAIYSCNVILPKFSGRVQAVSTVIKIIPLLVIGFVGIFSGEALSSEYMNSVVDLPPGGFFAALIAIAFSFDGWIVATSISGEVINAKKTLPKALVLGTVAVLSIYVIYFVGMTNLVPAEEIIALGDAHVNEAASLLLGPIGGKLLIGFVVISVYGGLNGVVLGFTRLPHALVSNKLMKNMMKIDQVSDKHNTPIRSALFGIPFIAIYMIIHYLSSVEGNIFNAIGFDIGSLPILVNYVLYIFLFYGVFKMARKGEVPKKNLAYSLIAIVVALIVIVGSLPNNGVLYIIIGIVSIIIGLPFADSDLKSKKL